MILPTEKRTNRIGISVNSGNCTRGFFVTWLDRFTESDAPSNIARFFIKSSPTRIKVITWDGIDKKDRPKSLSNHCSHAGRANGIVLTTFTVIQFIHQQTTNDRFVLLLQLSFLKWPLRLHSSWYSSHSTSHRRQVQPHSFVVQEISLLTTTPWRSSAELPCSILCFCRKAMKHQLRSKQHAYPS